MNRIVTIDELARTVAQFNSCHESDALAFVRETFALAYETLAAGDAVVIKGLGEFSGTEGSVLYRPDRELADAVNAPFAAFSAVELPDGMDLIEDDQPSGDGDDVAETGIDPEPVVVDMQQEPACAEDIPAVRTLPVRLMRMQIAVRTKLSAAMTLLVLIMTRRCRQMPWCPVCVMTQMEPVDHVVEIMRGYGFWPWHWVVWRSDFLPDVCRLRRLPSLSRQI